MLWFQISASEPTLLLQVPDPSEPAAIERDDFPAPQYPYSDPERRRRRTASAEDAEAAEEPAEDDGDTKLEVLGTPLTSADEH